MLKGKDIIIRGAILLGGATFIAKLLGAFYRVPLTNLIGSFGLGLYQMVFPVYALLLDLSGAGVPTALSKIISSFNGEDRVGYAKSCLKASIKIFLVVGVIFAFAMAIFCKKIAVVQGNANAWLGYLFLSPAIIPVCILSCFRGYFQGLLKMSPTALSQITEQLVKLCLGLLFARLALPNIPRAVAGATFAITISEFVALLQIYLTYKKHACKQEFSQKSVYYLKQIYKPLIKMVIPITLTGIILPLSQVIDSFMIINLLSRYRQDATNLYGVLSGVAVTVIGLPVAMCHGVCTVALPSVSSCPYNQKQLLSQKALLITAIFAMLSAVICYYFAHFIVGLLFRSLNYADKTLAINLIKILSPSVIFLALLHTENSLLIAYGKQKIPPITLLLGAIVKLIINFVLISNPVYNIYGGAFGLIACYFLPCLINLIILTFIKVKNESSITKFRQLQNG